MCAPLLQALCHLFNKFLDAFVDSMVVKVEFSDHALDFRFETHVCKSGCDVKLGGEDGLGFTLSAGLKVVVVCFLAVDAVAKRVQGRSRVVNIGTATWLVSTEQKLENKDQTEKES